MDRAPPRFFVLLVPLAALALSGGGDSAADAAMTFSYRAISTATTTGGDLYEPSVVASGGRVYVTGHSPPSGTKAPAWVSHDNGVTWAAMPGNGYGKGTEGTIAIGDGGRAWQADFEWPVGTNLPLYGFCDHGATLCEYAANVRDPIPDCGGEELDRAWTAYGHGRILVANKAAGRVQVGVLDATNLSNRAWACGGAGYMGNPAVRESDGMLAIPANVDQVASAFTDEVVIWGADAATLARREGVFRGFRHQLSCNGGENWGFAAFDAEGALHVALAQPSDGGGSETIAVARATEPGGEYAYASLTRDARIYFYWISGSETGSGALLTWAETTELCPLGGAPETSAVAVPPLDFYAAHVRFDGSALSIVDVSKVATITGACGDYMGSDVGSDGRAFVVAFSAAAGSNSSNCPVPAGLHPLRLYVQSGGPLL